MSTEDDINNALSFIRYDTNFVPTSYHPSWQGKVQCKYCKVGGWPGSVQKNPRWWGQRHGSNCKRRYEWLFRNSGNTINSVTSFGVWNTSITYTWV